MIREPWSYNDRKMLVCIDSYNDGVLQGRMYTTIRGMDTFDSLSQFLVRMEGLLEESRMPQAYTAARSFGLVLPFCGAMAAPGGIRRGALATFELQILFRQHSSWQGRVFWREKRKEQSFRSVLELVLLMDSALRCMEGCDAV